MVCCFFSCLELNSYIVNHTRLLTPVNSPFSPFYTWDYSLTQPFRPSMSILVFKTWTFHPSFLTHFKVCRPSRQIPSLMGLLLCAGASGPLVSISETWFLRLYSPPSSPIRSQYSLRMVRIYTFILFYHFLLFPTKSICIPTCLCVCVCIYEQYVDICVIVHLLS